MAKAWPEFVFVLLIYHWSVVTISGNVNKCVEREYGWGSIVCVCNSTYCDEIGEIESVPSGYFTVYTSSKAGLRFDRKTSKFASCPTTHSSSTGVRLRCKVKPMSELKQTVLGFGGAFTDAAGININSLSAMAKRNLMEAYFSSQGIEYTLCRIPMASTDFSTHFYTYQDNPHDPFKLANEDFVDKLPLIHMANSMTRRGIQYFASPWSAPLWMRTDDQTKTLRTSSYQLWAQYFINFLDAYKENNITIWGVTSQNEPFFSTYISQIFPDGFDFIMQLTPIELLNFVSKNLKPTLKSSQYANIKLMVFDDNLPLLPMWQLTQQFPVGSNFCELADGTAFHWYFNRYMNYNTTLTGTHHLCPDNFLLATEACVGPNEVVKVKLGSWENAEEYGYDIIKDLQNWATGWVDWNIALNEIGGPNWIKNYVDSPIIVNASEDSFYKQPMYYALGHFSKFIPPGYRIVDISCNCPDESIEMVAAVSDNMQNGPYNIVVVVLNRGSDSKLVDLDIFYGHSSSICINIPGKAIQTYLWNLKP